MNAYELADALEKGELIEFFEKHTQFWKVAVVKDSATMLRQQADRIAELESLYWQQVYKNIPAQTKPHPKCDEACMYLCTAKPLSNEEIWDIWNKNGIGVPYEFARAIEERHGIK